MSEYIELIKKKNNLIDHEEFNIVNNVECITFENGPYKFNDGFLLNKDDEESYEELGSIICGVSVIDKIYFVPEVGEKFYYIDKTMQKGYNCGERGSSEKAYYNWFISRGVEIYKNESRIIERIKNLGWIKKELGVVENDR
jgi:hypothetical protein